MGLRSSKGITVPRRLVTPTKPDGIPGTGVMDSTTKTSRTLFKSIVKSSPPRAMIAARMVGAPAVLVSPVSDEAVPCAVRARSAVLDRCAESILLAHHLPDRGQQIFRLKRLDDIAVRPLLLAPELIALIALGCAENDRNVFTAVVILEIA